MIGMAFAALAAITLLSGFFSGSETALTAARWHRIRAMGKSRARSEAVRRVTERPERFLAAILIGNVFVNTLAGVLMTTVLAIGATSAESRVRAASIATGLTTVVLLVFGEMVPKSIAARRPEAWALAVIRPMQIVFRLLGPVARALEWLARQVLRLFGFAQQAGSGRLSATELRAMVEASDPDQEARLLTQLVRVTGRRLTEVMTPRRDIAALPVGAGPVEAIRLFRERHHSRIPVYRDNLDQILGILHVHDILEAAAFGAPLRIERSIRSPHYAPGAATLSQALVAMRESGSRMLVVVDEHGGVEGLVTLRKLLEIVGDPHPDELRRLPGGGLSLNGALTVSEANRLLEVEGVEWAIPVHDDYDTVAGYALKQFGRIPVPGNAVRDRGAEVEAVSLDGNRISRIRIAPPPSGTDGPAV